MFIIKINSSFVLSASTGISLHVITLAKQRVSNIQLKRLKSKKGAAAQLWAVLQVQTGCWWQQPAYTNDRWTRQLPSPLSRLLLVCGTENQVRSEWRLKTCVSSSGAAGWYQHGKESHRTISLILLKYYLL